MLKKYFFFAAFVTGLFVPVVWAYMSYVIIRDFIKDINDGWKIYVSTRAHEKARGLKIYRKTLQ